jgi:hypothetical protein
MRANIKGTIMENPIPAAFIMGVYLLWFIPSV